MGDSHPEKFYSVTSYAISAYSWALKMVVYSAKIFIFLQISLIGCACSKRNWARAVPVIGPRTETTSCRASNGCRQNILGHVTTGISIALHLLHILTKYCLVSFFLTCISNNKILVTCCLCEIWFLLDRLWLRKINR